VIIDETIDAKTSEEPVFLHIIRVFCTFLLSFIYWNISSNLCT